VVNITEKINFPKMCTRRRLIIVAFVETLKRQVGCLINHVFFNPNYAIGGAMSSELLALVGLTPIRESLFQCGEANCKRLILFIEYAISSASCIFWVETNISRNDPVKFSGLTRRSGCLTIQNHKMAIQCVDFFSPE